jgi:MFS family permease
MMAWCTQSWQLVTLRFLTAACAGTTAASQILIVKNTPEEKQGVALGILSSAYWCGAALGHVLGGLAVDRFGYTFAFVTCGITYAIAGSTIFFCHEDFKPKTTAVASAGRRRMPHWSDASLVSGMMPTMALLLICWILPGFALPSVMAAVQAGGGTAMAARTAGILGAALAVLAGGGLGWLAERRCPGAVQMPGLAVAALLLHLLALSLAPVLCEATRILLLVSAGGLLAAVLAQLVRWRTAPWREYPLAINMLLLMILFIGFVRSFEVPYVTMVIKEITGHDTAARWTGIISAFVTGGALLSGVMMGYLADRLKPGTILMPALAVSAVMLYLQAIATSLWVFGAARTLLYISAGGLQPVVQKLLSRITPPEKRGAVFGINSTTGNIGIMLATGASGWLIGHWENTRLVFHTAAVLTIVLMPICLFMVRYAGRSRHRLTAHSN